MSNSIEPARQPVLQSKDGRTDGGDDRLRRRFEALFDTAAGLPATPFGGEGALEGHGRMAASAAEIAGRRAAGAVSAEAGQAASMGAQPTDLHALLRSLPEEALHLRLAHGALAGLEIQLRRRGDHLSVRLRHGDRSRAAQVAHLCEQLSLMLGTLFGSANVEVITGDTHVASTR